MKPKKLIFWIIVGAVAYQGFNYVRVHTSGEVIVYKRFAKAIMKGDSFTARRTTVDELNGKHLMSDRALEELFGDSEIVMTYYRIRDRVVEGNGRTATLVADQVSRVNPEGEDVLWGAEKVVVRHRVELVWEEDEWLVAGFAEPRRMR